MDLSGYHALCTIEGLFNQVQLNNSRTFIYRNDETDLPADMIYEYGTGNKTPIH